MFDPEFIWGSFELCNKRTRKKKCNFGCCLDTSNCQAVEKILFESDSYITLERQILS